MATIYTKADYDVVALMESVMEKYHPSLKTHGVQVGVMMAMGDLKHQGWPAIALIRIVPQKDRAAGLPDAMIYLQAWRWNEFTDERRIAILDHELEHLIVVMTKEFTVKTDDCGRPKLRLRMHDYQIGGFESIIERHKEASIEAEAYRGVHKTFTQMLFPWG